MKAKSGNLPQKSFTFQFESVKMRTNIKQTVLLFKNSDKKAYGWRALSTKCWLLQSDKHANDMGISSCFFSVHLRPLNLCECVVVGDCHYRYKCLICLNCVCLCILSIRLCHDHVLINSSVSALKRLPAMSNGNIYRKLSSAPEPSKLWELTSFPNK